VATVVPRVDAVALQEANSQVWASLWAEAERDRTFGRLPLGALSLEAWQRSLRAVGIADEQVAKVVTDFHHELTTASFRLFEDVESFLVLLRSNGLRTAITTNGASETQREKISATGLDKLVDVAVVSAEVGAAKPDEAIFIAALDSLGCEPSDTCHIGDSLAGDIAGALGAGLTAIWMNRTGAPRSAGDPAPHFEVAGLAEVERSLVPG
jgi:putative hydrolase of the HAD superfamily